MNVWTVIGLGFVAAMLSCLVVDALKAAQRQGRRGWRAALWVIGVLIAAAVLLGLNVWINRRWPQVPLLMRVFL